MLCEQCCAFLYFDHIVQTVQFCPLLQQQKQNQHVDRLMTASSPKIHPSVSWESRQLPAPPPYTLRHAYTQRHTDTHGHTSAGPAGLTNIEEILDSGTIPVIAPTGTHRAIWSSSLQELMLGLFTTLPQMIWSSLSDRLALHSLPENLLERNLILHVWVGKVIFVWRMKSICSSEYQRV